MAKSSSRAARKPGGGGPRIDWGAAKAWFLADPTRSYREVGEKFNVSLTSVAKHARVEGWQDARKAANGRVERRLLERAVRSREERAEVMLRIADEYHDQLMEQMLERTLEIKLSDYQGIGKMTALILGDPTDRVTWEEQLAGFRAWLEVTTPYVPKAKRAEWLRRVNEALGAAE